MAVALSGCLGGAQSPKGPLVYVANEGDGTVSVIDSETLTVYKTIQLAGMPHNVNVDPLGRHVYATNHEGEAEEGTGHEGMHHAPYLRIIDAGTNEVVRSVAMPDMAAHAVPSRDGRWVFVSIEGSDKIVKVDAERGTIESLFTVGEGPHGFVVGGDGKLYVPNMRSNDVSIVDLDSGAEDRVNVSFENHSCETPVAMGITNDGLFSFVTCGKSFDVYKIDNDARQAMARVAFERGEFPGPIQAPVHPGGRYLYVPDMRHGVVHKIKIDSFTLEKDISTGSGAHGIAFSADGKFAFVTNTWEDTLTAIDLETDSTVGTVRVGSRPNGVAVVGGKNQGW